MSFVTHDLHYLQQHFQHIVRLPHKKLSSYPTEQLMSDVHYIQDCQQTSAGMQDISKHA